MMYMVVKDKKDGNLCIDKIIEQGFKTIYSTLTDVYEPEVIRWEDIHNYNNNDDVSSWPHDRYTYDILTLEEIEDRYFLEFI